MKVFKNLAIVSMIAIGLVFLTIVINPKISIPPFRKEK